MKICLVITLALFAACSNNAVVENNNSAQSTGGANANVGKAELSEKNKQIAVKNEVTKTTEAAQMLEKQGRQMDSYRLAADAESARQCTVVEADLQRQVEDLEAKIKNFPNPYNEFLTPITNDLNVCVSCSKTKAAAACVRARAATNEAIKQIFAR